MAPASSKTECATARDTAFNLFSADALRLPEFEITFKTVDGLPVKLFNFWEIDGLEMETTVK